MSRQLFHFVTRMFLDFFCGVGFFTYLSLLGVPLFSEETILVDRVFLYVLSAADGYRSFYLFFGTCFGIFFCYIDCLLLLTREVSSKT